MVKTNFKMYTQQKCKRKTVNKKTISFLTLSQQQSRTGLHVATTHPTLFTGFLRVSDAVLRSFSPLCVAFLPRSYSQEAAAGANHLHPLPARRPGSSVRQNPVPGHIHAGGGRTENQPA